MRTNVEGSKVTGQPMMGDTLYGIDRCPHCGIATPNMNRMWASDGPSPRRDGGRAIYWGCYRCARCGAATIVSADATSARYFEVDACFPEPKQAHADVPEPANRFLQQAFDTLHAPDAAAVMAGSAVDAMLKEKGLSEGSLYTRIDQALTANMLTQGMADWAHSVRLGSNRPRHADAENPHVSASEAKQSVDFAEALANFLFVLTARIERGLQKAAKAPAAAK